MFKKGQKIAKILKGGGCSTVSFKYKIKKLTDKEIIVVNEEGETSLYNLNGREKQSWIPGFYTIICSIEEAIEGLENKSLSLDEGETPPPLTAQKFKSIRNRVAIVAQTEKTKKLNAKLIKSAIQKAQKLNTIVPLDIAILALKEKFGPLFEAVDDSKIKVDEGHFYYEEIDEDMEPEFEEFVTSLGWYIEFIDDTENIELLPSRSLVKKKRA